MDSKILVLTKYGSLASSSRYRFYQYFPYLTSQGFDITVAPLLDNNYVAAIKTSSINNGHSKRNLINVLGVYFERLKKLLTARDYDLLWIEKELLPYLPAWLEKILIRDIPYVVDYDDAQFHIYDNYGSKMTKLLLSHKIDTVMANAQLVVVGNKYIETRANLAGAKRIEIIPTVVDLDRYSIKSPTSEKCGLGETPSAATFQDSEKNDNTNSFHIGWIGSPSTSRYLSSIQPALKTLNEKYNCKTTMIGAGNFALEDIELTIKNWHEDREVEDIKTFDVGIMPLNNSPWEQGKCGIKLIQYMACGLPVIGTPIGVNQEIIQHGVNGFQANSLDEWTEYLSRLSEDPHLRSVMGAKGRLMVEASYSLQIFAPKLARLLRSCL